MNKQRYTLISDRVRENAISAVKSAPEGWRVTIEKPKRSDEQNRRMWAMLSDISQQVIWHGKKLSSEDWKEVFSAALKEEIRAVPNIDGTGFVVLSPLRTSELSKDDFSNLFVIIEKFCAERWVKLSDPFEVES